MKTSHLFTTLRIVLAPVFFILFFIPIWTGDFAKASVIILIPLFIFMELTDFFDGYYARKKNEVSDFGKVFDPFADVLANLTVLFCFTLAGYLHPLFFILIFYREFGITFVRMVAIKKGVAIAAKMGGKIKTVMYIVAAGFSLAIESIYRLSLQSFFSDSFFNVVSIIGFSLYIIAAILSVATFLDYIRSFKDVLKS